MATTTWLRPTQISKTFPSNKYSFTKYLTREGDWIETGVLTREEYIKIKKAVNFWAWRKQYTIQVKSVPMPNDCKIVRIFLVKKHRNRDYG